MAAIGFAVVAPVVAPVIAPAAVPVAIATIIVAVIIAIAAVFPIAAINPAIPVAIYPAIDDAVAIAVETPVDPTIAVAVKAAVYPAIAIEVSTPDIAAPVRPVVAIDVAAPDIPALIRAIARAPVDPLIPLPREIDVAILPGGSLRTAIVAPFAAIDIPVAVRAIDAIHAAVLPCFCAVAACLDIDSPAIVAILRLTRRIAAIGRAILAIAAAIGLTIAVAITTICPAFAAALALLSRFARQVDIDQIKRGGGCLIHIGCDFCS